MRDSTDIATAISAVNEIVAAQNAALSALKTTLVEKAAGGTDLSALEVYVANFNDPDDYVIEKGSIDRYWDTLIS